MSSVKQQMVNKLYTSPRKITQKQRVEVKSLNDLIQADIVGMQLYPKTNIDFRYILVFINVFKFVWTRLIGELLKR